MLLLNIVRPSGSSPAAAETENSCFELNPLLIAGNAFRVNSPENRPRSRLRAAAVRQLRRLPKDYSHLPGAEFAIILIRNPPAQRLAFASGLQPSAEQLVHRRGQAKKAIEKRNWRCSCCRNQLGCQCRCLHLHSPLAELFCAAIVFRLAPHPTPPPASCATGSQADRRLQPRLAPDAGRRRPAIAQPTLGCRAREGASAPSSPIWSAWHLV